MGWVEIDARSKTLGLGGDGRLRMLRQALSQLALRLRAAWLYGSVAKQTDMASSDIDVMVIGDGLALGEVLECLLPVEVELGRKVNPTCYTSAEFERRRAEPDSFVSRVLEQPIVLLVGEVDECAGAR